MYRCSTIQCMTVTGLAAVLACSLSSAYAVNAVKGGKMYDNWWLINGAPQPMGDHPLYPPVGQQVGSTTYRCKECHGWDYKGRDGAYGSGMHFTDIIGVFGSAMTAPQMFNIIKNDSVTTTNGHDFGAIGLSDADINDLVEFLQTLVVDTDTYIGGSGAFIGDVVQGETNFQMGGAGLCWACHGEDGRTINFSGNPSNPVWLGTIADANPWEFMHKIRFGNPAALAMPSWTGNGGSDQGAADIGLYTQTLPAGPGIPAVSQWGVLAMMLLLLTAGTLAFQRRSTVHVS